MFRAVCLLAQRDDGRILAVSRKDDPTKFGLPGGKVEPGETDVEALVREVREETGFTVSTEDAQAVFLRVCNGDVDFETVTYYVSTLAGEPHTEEPVVIAWVDPRVLLAGPFGDYNRALFDKIGIRMEVS